MKPLSVGRSRADHRLAEPMPFGPSPDATAGARPGSSSPDAQRDADLGAVLSPMLFAMVRLAGADAGVIKVIGQDGASFESVADTGLPRSDEERASWCATCVESRDVESSCVKSNLCGHDERIPADVLGFVCKHRIAVPLRYRDRPVGTLQLLFAAEATLPPVLTPLLGTAGDLLGVTLENARLARENLRIRINSERQMLASEVHDSLAQGLTYMRMRMSLLRDAIRDGDELRARKYCGDIDDTLGNSQRRLRELITFFRSRIDAQGLLHALREKSDHFEDRTGIALDFDNRLPDLRLPPEREIEVFHIVQEALANVCRHAQATRARLVLDRRNDDYVIAIEDDGVGIAAGSDHTNQDSAGHYGLAIMRERARRLDGDIVLSRAAGNGTRLELTFPVLPTRIEACQ
ncbi:MAG: hypothetical protein IT521_11680 [Burkholderiales bacterium]|nr:hypothetical protein [Burkholderiales bacterium]